MQLHLTCTFLLLIARAVVSLTAFPTADDQVIKFYTEFDNSLQIPSCGSVTVNYSPAPGKTPALPLHFAYIADGYPIRSPPNGAVLNQDTGTFTFDMPFPSGTAVTFYMWDDAAGSGGAIGPYTVSAGSSSCSYITFGSGSDLTVDSSTVCNALQLTWDATAEQHFFYIIQPYPAVSTALVSSGTISSGDSVDFRLLLDPGAEFIFFTLQPSGDTYISSNAVRLTIGDTNNPACATTPIISTSIITSSGSSSSSDIASSTRISSSSMPSPAPSTSSTSSSSSSSTSSAQPTAAGAKSVPVAGIAGGVVAGVAGLAILLTLLLCLRRRNKRKDVTEDDEVVHHYPPPMQEKRHSELVHRPSSLSFAGKEEHRHSELVHRVEEEEEGEMGYAGLVHRAPEAAAMGSAACVWCGGLTTGGKCSRCEN